MEEKNENETAADKVRGIFIVWLATNKNYLCPSSIKAYGKAVFLFVKTYGEATDVDINKINEFIACSEEKRVNMRRAAMIHYLASRERMDLKEKLTKTRTYPPKKHDIPPLEKVTNLINSLPGKNRIIAIIQYYTGLRSGDVFRATNFRMEGEKLIISGIKKGMKEYSVSLINPSWAKIVFDYTDKRKFNEYPLMTGHSKAGTQGMVTNNYLTYYKSFREAAKKADVSMTSHDLRRMFAQDLEKAGFSIRDIQIGLDHARIDTTLRYLSHKRKEHEELARAIRK